MTPEFASEDPTLLAKWSRWRNEDDPTPWAGPLPPGYVFKLPTIVRQTMGPLIVSRDVLARLEAGAMAVRDTRKLHKLDCALFIEATITRQAQQWDAFPIEGREPVKSFRCYINRAQFLADYLGKGSLETNPKRANEQFMAAIEVNMKGGLFIAHELEKANKRDGKLRDMVVPNPAILPSLDKRAEGAERAALRRSRRPVKRGRKTAKPRAE